MKKKIRLNNPELEKDIPTKIQNEPNKVPFESLTPIELIKKSQKYQFGNRPDYFHRRGTDLEGVDSRLLNLDRNYLEGKSVLDIGCHTGIVSLQIAKHFNARCVKGIDIDYTLINEAVTNWSREEKLALIAKQKSSNNPEVIEKLDTINSMPRNIKELDSGLSKLLGKREAEPGSKMDIEKGYPHNVSFEISNIIDLEESRERHKYEAIVCFSLTKWVHLNYGDEGIKKMFKKIKMALSKGGILILEIQKFKSYNKKIKEFSRFKEIYPTISFRPEEFESYLLNELGFKKLANLGTLQQDDFKRDIEVYELMRIN